MTYLTAGPHRWVEGAIVYHIYPRSFQDSNGDGVGDLQGIEHHLPYLKTLGVNAIWLSPFYPSPMVDFGYDVADYCDVDPLFGTLDDFKNLLEATHSQGIKVMIDLVPNHTSDEHPWFTESRQSSMNSKKDWYVWRDPAVYDDRNSPVPPNNWRNVLTGQSAWEWEPQRKQFYLHSFDAKQPDLNWTNPEVREAFKDIMRFWLDMGVDGFRVDAVYWLAKEPRLSDDALNPDYVEGEQLRYDALLHNNSRGAPEVYAYLSDLCDVLKESRYQQEPRFMVTEAYPERHDTLAAYLSFYSGMDPAVAAPFNFEGVSLPWEAGLWRQFLTDFHTALDQLSPLCVSSYAFGNHDQPRLASRIGVEAARSAAVMLLTLPGVAFVYYGEELGMENVPIPAEYVHDPAAKGDPKHGVGRDPERTPMQWNSAKQAGFSEADHTWLPLARDYTTHNVEAETDDTHSFLSMYRALGQLRNNSDALKYGSLTVIDSGDPNVLAYIRQHDDAQSYLVCINFSDQSAHCHIKQTVGARVISSIPDQKRASTVGLSEIIFAPHEATVFTL